MMDRVIEKFGRIDILSNNAGGGSGAGEGEICCTEDEACKSLGVVEQICQIPAQYR